MQADTSVRDQIIATATRLFQSQGYNQTGVNQIIEEAKVAKASLYYHFPSKEDLGVAYLAARWESWYAGLEKYLEGESDPQKRLIKVLEYRAIFVQQNNYAGCSYTRILLELPQRGTKMHSRAIANKEMQRKFFRELIQQIDAVPAEKKESLPIRFSCFSTARQYSARFTRKPLLWSWPARQSLNCWPGPPPPEYTTLPSQPTRLLANTIFIYW